MNSLVFTTEEDGIFSAERALDELREFLHITPGGTASEWSRVPPFGLGNIDKEIALRTQLENLEEMMRMVTDAWFARSLIEDNNERALVGQRDNETSLEMLRFIVMTAEYMLSSQTYEDPNGYDDDDTEFLDGLEGPPGAWPSNSVVVGYGHTSLAGRKNDEIPDPTCLVCGEILFPQTRYLQSPCGHFYCPPCTVNLVEAYTSKQFTSSPLRCCPSPKLPIPPQYVHQFINTTLRQRLDERLVEANTPLESRVYCPQCGKFIDPARITPAARAAGVVICPNLNVCRANICLGCKGLAHRGVDCQRHADDAQALEIQRQFGWGRCPGCRYVVEKINGCSHVKCARCGADFTYSPMVRKATKKRFFSIF